MFRTEDATAHKEVTMFNIEVSIAHIVTAMFRTEDVKSHTEAMTAHIQDEISQIVPTHYTHILKQPA